MYDIFYRLGAIWIAFINSVPEPLQSCLSWVTGMLFRMFSSGKQGMRGKSGQMPPLLDLLAAFFVVKQQRNHRGTVLEKPKNDPPPEHWMPQQPHESHHEWRLVERCAQLAVGMYTYPTYLILPSRDWFRCIFFTFWNMFRLFLIRLRAYIRSIFIPLPITREVYGDGILWQKTAAFLASSGTSVSDLQTSSFQNGVCQTPFALVTDHDNDALIVAIRGSISLSDWITDANIYSRVVPELFRDGKMLALMQQLETEIEKNSKGNEPAHSFLDSIAGKDKNNAGTQETNFHGAMFLCAVYIYGMVIRMISPMIDKSPLDGDAEERDGERGWLRMIPGFGYNGYCRGELSEYKILVTGHSLGAGVASLLTLLLRATYGEKVRGYCFSPPGCMVSENVLPLTKKCIMSFVVGDDIVPRLSIHSFSTLQEELEAQMQMESPDYMKYPANSERLQIVHGSMKMYRRQPKNKKADGRKEFEMEDMSNDYKQPKLFAPGHILHFTEQVDKDSGYLTFKSQWITAQSLQTIVFSPQMFNDHMAKRVERIVTGNDHVWWLKFVPFDVVRNFIMALY